MKIIWKIAYLRRTNNSITYKIYGYKYLKQLNYTCKNCDKALEKTQLVIAVLFSQMMPYIISF